MDLIKSPNAVRKFAIGKISHWKTALPSIKEVAGNYFKLYSMNLRVWHLLAAITTAAVLPAAFCNFVVLSIFTPPVHSSTFVFTSFLSHSLVTMLGGAIFAICLLTMTKYRHRLDILKSMVVSIVLCFFIPVAISERTFFLLYFCPGVHLSFKLLLLVVVWGGSEGLLGAMTAMAMIGFLDKPFRTEFLNKLGRRWT